jgi:probable HAF family extracellular repeat protein
MRNNNCALRIGIFILACAVAVNAAGPQKLKFKFTTVSVQSASATYNYAINNSGVIVGAYLDAGDVQHGFMRRGKQVTTLDDPNGSKTYCMAINGKGAIVGFYMLSGLEQAFLYENGTFTDIGPPGALLSIAYGINDKGESPVAM